MTTPDSASRSPAPGATDERIKAIGLQILIRFSATTRLGRAYQPDNQVFQRALEGVLEALTPALVGGEAVLVALDEDLYLNGVRIPYRQANIRFHKHVLEEFGKRRIAGFRARLGLEFPELISFFRFFLQADVYSGTDLLTACLAQGGDKILPVIHASTEAPEDNFEYDASTPWTDESADDEGDGPFYPGGESAGVHLGEDGGSGPAGPRGAARKRFNTAMAGAKSLLMTTSLHGGMELKHAKRVVQPLVDGAFAGEPPVVGLATLGHHDEYTYAHAVNVCLVAVTLGHYLELDRRALADLGVAALLHDVGKAAVGERITHAIDEFTEEERALAESHPLEGIKLLARSTTLNPTTLRCMRVALEHHVAADGSGYPKLGRWTTSLLSRLVSVADCYVSLQTHRSARGASVTPYEALGMMLGPLKSRFHPAMLWALVMSVGLYPPGQLVELDDTALAMVLAPNLEDPARPHVRILRASNGLAPPEPTELRPLPLGRSVRRALRGDEYPQDSAAA